MRPIFGHSDTARWVVRLQEDLVTLCVVEAAGYRRQLALHGDEALRIGWALITAGKELPSDCTLGLEAYEDDDDLDRAETRNEAMQRWYHQERWTDDQLRAFEAIER